MNRAIPDEIIEEIRHRCDIVEVIGSVVQLRRAGGGTYKGLCPFHQEKTPSFTVNQNRGHYHCFGCGKGGDVFRFVMEREGVDFPNAIHLLAARCGVVIPETGASSRENRARADERERLYQINEEFARFFERQLREQPEAPAARYLASRGIPEEVARQFRLGFAPDEWDACVRYGRALGFREQELLQAGIVRRHEGSGRFYDHFKGRLTFAIWNETGKVVGFSARSLEAHPATAKYVNTAETPVFRKGELLYALPLARTAIRDRKLAVLCEGQLDTIAFHRAGVTCAVAPQGTAFTEMQARILRRYTGEVALAFDADGAGQKAIRRALEILLPLDLEVRVIRIPGGKDPDELFRSAGPEAVSRTVDDAGNWLDWRCDALPAEFDLNRASGRSQAVDEVVSLLKLVPNPVRQEFYLRAAAARLLVSESAIHAELGRLAREERRRFNGAGGREPSTPPPQPVQRTIFSPRRRAELTLLGVALHDPGTARRLSELLPAEELSSELSGKTLELVIGCALNGEPEQALPRIEELLRETPDPELSRVLLDEAAYSPEESEQVLSDCVKAIHQDFLRQERLRLLAEIRGETDPARQLELAARLQSLN